MIAMENDELSTFSKEDVQVAINELCSRLNLTIDRKLLVEYQNGHHPTLLSYEKVDKPEIALPTILKYLMGAQTYCDAPVNYYDIFRSCRHTIFIQKLNEAIKICDKRTKGLEARLTKLLLEEKYDPFDSIMFEILTAAQYSRLASTKEVIFLDETTEKSPDLKVVMNDVPLPLFVECKKFHRNTDLFIGIRDRVQNICSEVFQTFYGLDTSAIIDLEFYCSPDDVKPAEIAEQCFRAFRKHSYIRGPKIGTKITTLSIRRLDDYLLFPSAKYYWERYQFRPQGEWYGIAPSMKSQPAHVIEELHPIPIGVSTWISEVDWECAVRWRICNEELQRRIRKLNYNRIFQGLEQLKLKSPFSTLHLWFEREGADTIRQSELMDVFFRLEINQKDIYSWIVFNETILETSPMGIFDIIEHAHFITCSVAPQDEPFVSTVFLDEIPNGPLGEFGRGREMPDIDDEFRKRGWV
jgi:hypothetical protein